MKVLIIEDDKKISNMYKITLELNNMQAVVSLNGRHGLELIQNDNFDAILLDIAMPEFSGLDVIDALEKNNKLKEQKIIVITASILSDNDVGDLKKRGIFGVLQKPVKIDVLLDALK